MKKIIVLSIVVIGFIVSTPYLIASNAGGKNHLNPDNFQFLHDEASTHTALNLDAGTYTFSMPNRNLMGTHYQLRISSNYTDYVNVNTENLSGCTLDGDYTVCTFNLSTSTNINVEIIATNQNWQSDLNRYMTYYHFEGFQLEEGTQRTTYEPYYNAGDPLRYFQGEETLVVDYHDPVTVQGIIDNYITAHDDIDGDVSDSIYVISDSYTQNASKVGDYEIYLGAYDDAGNESTLRLKMVVIDTVSPVITKTSDPIFMEGHAESVENIIRNHFELVDDHDGPLETINIISDAYTQAAKSPGFYDVTFEIEDTSQNKASKTFTIELVDNTPPTVDGPPTVRYGLNETITTETLFALFQYRDNHSANESIIRYLLDESVIDSFNTIGFYDVYLVFEDEAGNQRVPLLQVEIFDDLPPVIEGPDVLETGYEEILSLSEIKAYFDVYDDIDPLTVEDLVVVEDNYSTMSHIPGIYSIKFSASDQEHTTYHTLMINVIDNIPPVFIVDSAITLLLNDLNETTLFDALSTHQSLTDFKPVAMQINHQETQDNQVYYQVSLENALGEQVEKDILVNIEDSSTFPVIEVTVLTTVGIVGILVIKKLKRQ